MVKRKASDPTTAPRVLVAPPRTRSTAINSYAVPIDSITSNNTADTSLTAIATTMVITDSHHLVSSPSSSSLLIFSSVLENVDVVKFIVEYVGPNQYQFVATINRSFHDAHSKVFPEGSTTFLNASTVELAKYCSDDLLDIGSQEKLCSTAAKYGNLPVLQYLVSVDCEWDDVSCWNAASYGHLHILKWIVQEGETFDPGTCSDAALHGRLHIL